VITRASCGQITARHDAAGTPELRRAIAAHLLETRGMRVNPRQVVVGAGAQTLYGIIIQLLGRSKIYAAENPGYTRLQKIYQLNDVKFVPVPLDAQGMRVDALTAAGAHVAHVMPQHNLATGAVMRAPRRAQLLAWAAGAPDRYIIEDDYDCQLRFAGRPITPLAAAGAADVSDAANAQNGEGPKGSEGVTCAPAAPAASTAAQKVIYTNTFTKTMGGAFRIGYMVLPPQLAEKFARELAFYSPTVGILDQLALADFITSGAYARHVRRVRTQLKKTCTAFTSATSNPFTVEGVGAGAHFILKAPANLAPTVMAATPASAALGVKFTPLSAYFMEPQPASNAAAGPTAASDTFANQTNTSGTRNTTGIFTVDCTAATPETAAHAAALLF
jgi:GntR family transcriptional regulator/MocR family aminotransferase